MTKKIVLEEGAQRALEINGKIYNIAQRTGELEQKIIDEHDSVRTELTEYERYKVLITLFLGETAFDELFPLGEADSLDRMAQIAYHAQHEFNAGITALEKQKLEEQFDETGLDAIESKLSGFNRQIDKTLAKAEWAKKQAHKK